MTFDWDKEYNKLVDTYARLARQKAWVEYMRGCVKEKQINPLFKTLGKDVATKIKELETELLTNKEK